MSWRWLTGPQRAYSWRFVRRVLLKTAILFVALNVVYVLLDPLPWLGRRTLYNALVPGRARLPFAENPSDAYSVSIAPLGGMLAAHEYAAAPNDPASGDEFRVLLLGDSAVWGWLLEPDETLSACLNGAALRTADGRTLRAYNLGYPVLALLKDVMILDAALAEHPARPPDAVIWLTTLAAFYPHEQLRHPIVRQNAAAARRLIARYELRVDAAALPDPAPWERTIIGQRRALADLLRHQVYALAWWLTGIDHVNPKFDQLRREDLPPGDDIFGRPRVPGGWTEDNLAVDALRAGLDLAAAHDVPVLLVNEPIFRSDGLNSDVRYNGYYPRWAYDSYRDLMVRLAAAHGWRYLDLWDAMPNDQFTDTSLHLTPAATCDFAARLAPAILALSEAEP